jgi:hypothetical protein
LATDLLGAFVCLICCVSIKSIAVFGDDAEGKPQAVDGGSGGVIPPFIISPLSALKTKAAQRSVAVTNTSVQMRRPALGVWCDGV